MVASLSNYFAYCGLHYTKCPVEIRERFAKVFSTPDALTKLKEIFSRHAQSEVEVVPITTCNRFDVCILGKVTLPNLVDAFAELAPQTNNVESLLRYAFDEDAVRMLFRIACSLDSLVLGEPHILGQLKDAFTIAVSQQWCGNEATTIFNRCFQVAKRVRSETALGQRGVSVGNAAVEVARRVYNDLSVCRVAIVGAGEMARIAAQHVSHCGAKDVLIFNRTLERAAEIAGSIPRARALPLSELAPELIHCDVVIVATAAQSDLVVPSQFVGFAKKRLGKTNVIVDISVPRNVDPAVGDIENIFVFNVDDLDKVMSENRDARSAAAADAEKIIEDEVRYFVNLRKQRANLYFVGRFHAWSRQLVQIEIDRSLKKAGIQLKTDSIADSVAKRLVTSVAALAKADVRLDGGASVGDALEHLFQLSEQKLVDTDDDI